MKYREYNPDHTKSREEQKKGCKMITENQLNLAILKLRKKHPNAAIDRAMLRDLLSDKELLDSITDIQKERNLGL